MSPKNENNLADQDLIEKVLSGDTHAFGMIIKRTERLVAQIVFKMINDSEERKDIAQDVYVKTFRNLSTFKYQSKLSTWIAKIAYNTCLNYLEKKKLISFSTLHENNETDEETMDYVTNHSSSTSNNDVEAFMFQKQLAEILKIEIEKLPPLYKTLITLYHNEELSYSEIAQITELPEGTLKNYLFRARKVLKENLLQKYKGESL